MSISSVGLRSCPRTWSANDSAGTGNGSSLAAGKLVNCALYGANDRMVLISTDMSLSPFQNSGYCNAKRRARAPKAGAYPRSGVYEGADSRGVTSPMHSSSESNLSDSTQRERAMADQVPWHLSG